MIPPQISVISPALNQQFSAGATVDIKLSVFGSNLSDKVLVYLGDSSADVSSGSKVVATADSSNSAVKNVSVKLPDTNGQKYIFVAFG